MPLVIIKEDGGGVAGANSYAAVADGDAYHEGHLYAAEWKAATAESKGAALVMATRVIDALYQFRGAKAYAGQGLQWPRTGAMDDDAAGAEFAANRIPAGLVSATIETARMLLKADRTADPEGQGTRTVTDFNLKSVTYDANDRRPVIPRVAQGWLAKLGESAETKRQSGTVPLVRT